MEPVPESREVIRIVREATANALKECGLFPKRLDQMTPDEYAIASMVCSLTGTMTFLNDLAARWEEGNRDEGVQPAP